MNDQSLSAGRELYRARHARREHRDAPATFEDVAGSKLAEGRALYEATHGSTAAQQVLDDVHNAYRATATHTERERVANERVGRALRDIARGES